MPEAGFRRVLRSEDLPAPRSRGHPSGRVRERALTGTEHPDFVEVEVAGEPLLLTRLPSGEPVAFAAHCPHQGTPLRHGSLYEGNLRCPQHNYVYDVHSGHNILPTRDARPAALQRLKPGYLPVHPVRERDGWIWVAEEAAPPPSPEEAPWLRGDRPASPDRVTAPPPPPRQPEPDTPVEHEPESVEVQAGEEFTLTLPTRVRPGHLWLVEVDGEAVEVLGQDFEQGEGPVRFRIHARARSPGKVAMVCSYAKPWTSRAAEIRRFTVVVG